MRILKFSTVIVVIALLSGIVPFATMADSPASWAAEQVNEAIAAKLVPENLQSKYTQPTTRAEFCALAVALYENVKGEITGRKTFSDTNDANVQKAAAIGIVSGIAPNVFAPNDNLTREQAAVMLSSLANSLNKPFPQRSPAFADNSMISSWASAGVGQAQAAGVMGGTGGNNFSPKESYSRQQSIVTILRLYNIVTGASSFPPVPPVLNSLPISQSLKKGMTDAEFDQAYNKAYNIVVEFAGYTKDEMIMAVYIELATIRRYSYWEYSMSEKHYNDVYGFFILNRTSCAGDVRAAALCLAILGIPSEHVNENQYGHQWLRVELDGDYVVLDVNAPYIGYELEAYKHPLIQ